MKAKIPGRGAMRTDEGTITSGEETIRAGQDF